MYQTFRSAWQKVCRPCNLYPLPPRRTGRADFPHPALRQSLSARHAQGVDGVPLLGLATQLPSQKRDLDWHARFRSKPFGHPVRNGAFMAQAESPFFDRNMTEVQPLGSTGITPLPCYYGPLRLPATAGSRVIDSPRPLSVSPTHTMPGLPGSSADLSSRALPNHPERSNGCLHSFLPRQWQASTSSAGWPPPCLCNEAEAGSLSLGLTTSLYRRYTPLSPIDTTA